jgi:1-acyl-sn-glycerol-3-phosphate acyltransferase
MNPARLLVLPLESAYSWSPRKEVPMSTTGTTARAYSSSWRLVSVIVLRPLVWALIRNRWDGRENIPRTGGVILAVNHLSYLDWAPDCAFFHACGRYPVFMIKASAFGVTGIGGFLRKAGQLPVHRGSRDAALALSEAEKRLAEGAAVVFYPEGTATRDPARWPMAARTGVARLALATGVPVIPVAHWGTQDILPYGEKKPRLLPRKTVRVVAGRPVDLSPWAGQQHSAKALRTATDAIMAQVTQLVGHLRGEIPPPVPYDPRTPAIAGPESMTKPLPETPSGRLGRSAADPPSAS